MKVIFSHPLSPPKKRLHLWGLKTWLQSLWEGPDSYNSPCKPYLLDKLIWHMLNIIFWDTSEMAGLQCSPPVQDPFLPVLPFLLLQQWQQMNTKGSSSPWCLTQGALRIVVSFFQHLCWITSIGETIISSSVYIWQEDTATCQAFESIGESCCLRKIWYSCSKVQLYS